MYEPGSFGDYNEQKYTIHDETVRRRVEEQMECGAFYGMKYEPPLSESELACRRASTSDKSNTVDKNTADKSPRANSKVRVPPDAK